MDSAPVFLLLISLQPQLQLNYYDHAHYYQCYYYHFLQYWLNINY